MLEGLYEKVEDVDLYVGLFLERRFLFKQN